MDTRPLRLSCNKHELTAKFKVALESGLSGTVRHLIKQGASVNCVFQGDQTRPLDIAVTKNAPRLVKVLADNGADLEWTNPNDETVLFDAVKQRKLRALRELLRAGANVNHERIDGETALCAAVRDGNVEIVKLLISCGADVNHQRLDGATALFEAANDIHVEIVKLLITSGADVNVKVEEQFEQFNALDVVIGTYETKLWFRLNPLDIRIQRFIARMLEVIAVLIPLSGCVCCFRFEQCFAAEFLNARHDMKVVKLLLRHGFALTYPPMIGDDSIPDVFGRFQFIALLYRSKRYVQSLHESSEFISGEFVHLCLVAGCYFTYVEEHEFTYKFNAEEHRKLRPMFDLLLQMLATPLSLQDHCIKAVRYHLRGPPKLWENIDALPLPRPLKDLVKLKNLCPGRDVNTISTRQRDVS